MLQNLQLLRHNRIILYYVCYGRIVDILYRYFFNGKANSEIIILRRLKTGKLFSGNPLIFNGSQSYCVGSNIYYLPRRTRRSRRKIL